jgi:ribulose-bisphosphate carboxylase large chain
LGQVHGIADLGRGRFEVQIALSTASTGFEAGQLLNMLFGNSSLHDHIELYDAEFGPELAASFGGPALGISGWRQRLDIPLRPLTCSNLKPQGLSPADLAALAKRLALGGLDLIKDDHGLADQHFAPFRERVPRIAEAVRSASIQTGVQTRYLPHIVGNLDQLRRQLQFAQAEGLSEVLILPMMVGLPAFHTLRREYPSVGFMAHPALAGSVRVDPAFLLGRLFRLLGADAVVFPSYGGRFGITRETCNRLVANARAPWHTAKPSMPVPAGGMTMQRMPELLAFYGADTMLFVGGALLATDSDLIRETAAFVAAVSEPFSKVHT